MKKSANTRSRFVESPRFAFTLLELLVGMAVLAILVVLILSATNTMSSGVRSSLKKVDAFESARVGFEMMSQGLGNAVLNPYWEYYDAGRNPRTAGNASVFVPARYGRQSDLHFMIRDISSTGIPGGWDTVGHGVFFQAPGGDGDAAQTIGAEGYFVAFGEDPTFPGISGLDNPKRFRLYRWSQPPAELDVDPVSGRINADAGDAPWILPTSNVHPVADNIITLVARVPSTAARVTDDYFWNSRQPWTGDDQPNQMHQTPPMVELTMIAMDEPSAARLVGDVESASAAYAALDLPAATGLFKDPENYEEDLERVERELSSQGINYQILRLSVPVNGSRWSPN
jgi:uncharacterized protein (TIGR02599 family)